MELWSYVSVTGMPPLKWPRAASSAPWEVGLFGFPGAGGFLESVGKGEGMEATNVRAKGHLVVAEALRKLRQKTCILREQHEICSRIAKTLAGMRGRYPPPPPSLLSTAKAAPRVFLGACNDACAAPCQSHQSWWCMVHDLMHRARVRRC